MGHAVGMPSLLRTLTTAVVAGGAAVGAAVTLGRTLDGLGTRQGDLDAVLPGDDLHGPDALVRTRAITIAAPPADVWPWLVQLGWGRAGWYSIDALERLIGAARSVDADGTVGWRSLDTIVEAHQDLTVGDTIPLQRDVGFTVASLVEQQHLVGVFEGAGLRMVWALVLRDHGEATRLVVRTALDGESAVVRAAGRVVLDPGHAVMESVQLRRIKRRAEGYVDGSV